MNQYYLGEELVSGIIIEVKPKKEWALFYDGRWQGERGEAENDEEALEAGKQALQKIKDRLGRAFEIIYPEQKWEVRIYD